jgi:hypothetical protein
MKNKIISLFIIVFLLISYSCSEDYLAVENKNRLSVSSFYKTPEDALYALNTCYYGLNGTGGHGLYWYLLFGSFEDRILFETPNMDEITIGTGDGRVRTLWNELYIGLSRTTTFLVAMNEREIEGLKDENKNQYVAEARALRGAYYFHLVWLYNRPVYYDETSYTQDPLARFSNGEPEQFWDKAEEDLRAAIEFLPDSYPAESTGRITRGAANAMLGKMLLYKHYHYYVRNGNKGSAEDIQTLEDAGEAFLEVINSGVYSLVQPQAPKTQLDYIYAHLSNFSFVNLPSENNEYPGEYTSESVWQIQYSDLRYQNGWLPGWLWSGDLNFQYFSAHISSYRNHEIHPNLWLEFETEGAPAGFERDPRAYSTCYLDGDPIEFRPENEDYFGVEYTSGIHNKSVAKTRGLTFPGQPSVGFGLKKYYFPTYNDLNAPKNSPINRNVIRYADVLLMYAEVMYILGDDGSGLAALNEVRTRMDMPEIAALTADAIIHERDIELATEGHRYLDLIRWSLDPEWGIDWIEIYDGQNIFQVGKHEYLPIPLYEINLNEGLLKQNPGW